MTSFFWHDGLAQTLTSERSAGWPPEGPFGPRMIFCDQFSYTLATGPLKLSPKYDTCVVGGLGGAVFWHDGLAQTITSGIWVFLIFWHDVFMYSGVWGPPQDIYLRPLKLAKYISCEQLFFRQGMPDELLSDLIISQKFLLRIRVVDGKKDDAHPSQPLGWQNSRPLGTFDTIFLLQLLRLQDFPPIFKALVVNIFGICQPRMVQRQPVHGSLER